MCYGKKFLVRTLVRLVREACTASGRRWLVWLVRTVCTPGLYEPRFLLASFALFSVPKISLGFLRCCLGVLMISLGFPRFPYGFFMISFGFPSSPVDAVCTAGLYGLVREQAPQYQ